ncbi:MAG: heparinase II/III family protein [Tepidisphaeraceae bacterium]
MIADDRGRGNAALEAQLTAILRREIGSHNYDRAASPDDLVALTKYVAQLKSASGAGAPPLVRTFFGQPLNVLVQRNLTGEPETSLAAAIYGTAGGHIHANGLAIELYGAGLTMGADPGRGDSYWTKDQAEYYSQPPAHNTVIVNGRSDYGIAPKQQIPMTVQIAEPAWSDSTQPAAALCPNVGFAQCGFEYAAPVTAAQQRTLALVRPEGADSGGLALHAGFYFDVFRSRAQPATSAAEALPSANSHDQFHDYLYHNIGQLISLTDAAGQPLDIAASNQLDPDGTLLKGYTYFKNERSTKTADGWHARFGLTVADVPRMMDLWMPGQDGRTLFAVEAPPDHEARDDPRLKLMDQPMPTLIVRQRGDAWDRPFIAVYEPSTGTRPSSIESVETPRLSAQDRALAGCVVHGKSSAYTVLLMQDDHPTSPHADVNGARFQGSFGVVIISGNRAPQLYLGSGTMLSSGQESLAAIPVTPGQAPAPVSAALWPDGAGWRYSASAPVRVTIPFTAPPGTTAVDGLGVFRGQAGSAKSCPAQLRISPDRNGANAVLATVSLPADTDQLLTLLTPVTPVAK